MADLKTKTISDGVGDILAIDGGIDASTARQIKDGDGNVSPIYITTSKVGIGTTSPQATLQVEGLGNTVAQNIFTSDNVLDRTASLYFGTTPGARTKAGIKMINTNAGTEAGDLAFFTNAGISLNERMRIDSDGNVGIGTASPNTLLNIQSSESTPYDAGAVQSNGEGATLQIVNTNMEGMTSYAALQFVNNNPDGAGHARIVCLSESNDEAELAFTVEDGGQYVEAMRIDKDGNVGIGTSAPREMLHIGDTGAHTPYFPRTSDKMVLITSTTNDHEIAYALFVNDGANQIRSKYYVDDATKMVGWDSSYTSAWGGYQWSSAGTPLMNILSGGNVGIGTDSPDTLLHVSGEQTAIIRLDNPDSDVNANQIIGAIEFEQSVDSSGAGVGIKGAIRCKSAGSVGEDAYLTFHTASDATNDIERMRINEDGNVGIGTDAPGQDLDVENNQNASTAISINNQSTGAAADCRYSWYNSANNFNAIFYSTGHATLANKLVFTDSATSDVCFDISGNVGIGTTTPGVQLEVASSTGDVTIEINGNDGSDSTLHFTEEGHAQWNLQHISSGAYATQGDLRVWDYSDSSVAAHLSPTDNVWQAGSDFRIKKDIENIDSILSSINSLRPITWKRKYGKGDRTYAGLIAQEVLPNFPLVVSGTEDSFKEKPAKDAVAGVPGVTGVEAKEAVEAKDAVLDDDGNVTEEAVIAVEAVEAVEAVVGIEAQEATPLGYSGGLSIGYSNFVPYLIKAIQELSTKVTALENA